MITVAAVGKELQATAAAFAAALPASVTLPAGAGKTQLLAATVRHLVTDDRHKVLVLTHTNAGVAAVQRRLNRFGVSSSRARVTTISRFAFQLARAYPTIGQLQLPKLPTWADSSDYVTAAQHVATASNIRNVLTASFTHLLVDEYQDCSTLHHALVTALADKVPTGVLGYPMQGIFDFAEPLVTWHDTQQQFPDHPLDITPWRWADHNQALGQWLLALRDRLVPGDQLPLSGLDPGLKISFYNSQRDNHALRRAAIWDQWPTGDSVALLAPWEASARSAAAQLKGTFEVMEAIEGNFMANQLAALSHLRPNQYAAWMLSLTKQCCSGNAKLDASIQKALNVPRTVGHLTRPGLEPTLLALDAIITNPCFRTLADAMTDIRASPSLHLHSREAWRDIQQALRGAAAAGDDPRVLTDELARARERIRHAGRGEAVRVVSRTLLVKGLEYDHVVITDIDQIRDTRNLYVALTRARKSIRIIGKNPTITLT